MREQYKHGDPFCRDLFASQIVMEDDDPSADTCPLPAAAIGSVAADPAADEAGHDSEEPWVLAAVEPQLRTRPSSDTSESIITEARSRLLFPTELKNCLPASVQLTAAYMSSTILQDGMKAINSIAEVAYHLAFPKSSAGDTKGYGDLGEQLFVCAWTEESKHGVTETAKQAYIAAACLNQAKAWAALGYHLHGEAMPCLVAVLAAYKEAALLGDVNAMYNAACLELHRNSSDWTAAAHDWLYTASQAGDQDSMLHLAWACSSKQASSLWSTRPAGLAKQIIDWAELCYTNKPSEAACALLQCMESTNAELRTAAGACLTAASPLELHEAAACTEQAQYLCNFAVAILQSEVDDPRFTSSRAVSLFERAAGAGSAAAASNLGACYEHGSCVQTDFIQSVHWYTKALELGDPDAASDLSRVQQLQRDCDAQSEPETMLLFGAQFWDAKAVHDEDTASQCLKALLGAAELGSGEAALLGAQALEDMGVEEDCEALQMQLLCQAAEGGVSGSAVVLAAAIEGSAGDEVAFAQAATWYRVAALEGDLNGMFRLAVLLEDSSSEDASMKEEAVEWYRQAAERGHTGAQLCMGTLLEQGTAMQRDVNEAESWYKQAAVSGSAAAAFNVGRLYESGSLGSVDESTALEWYMTAGNAGDAQASFRVYEICRFQTENASQHEMAQAWLQQAADQGCDDAIVALRLDALLEQKRAGIARSHVVGQPVEVPCVDSSADQPPSSGPAHLMRRMSLSGSMSRQQWGQLQRSSSTAADVAQKLTEREAPTLPSEVSVEVESLSDTQDEGDAAKRDFALAQAAASSGDTVAQAAVAAMYYTGLGTAQDYIAARAWATRAAEAGVPSAQHQLGQMLLAGHGCKQSSRKAHVWLEEAAADGHSKSQVLLADILLEAGDAAGLARAKELLEAAAASGNAEANHKLGSLLMTEAAAGSADPTEAIARVREAAQQGSADAMCDLAMMYLQGIGVAQDSLSAKEWLKEAAKNGSSSAQNNLGLLYSFGPSLLPGSGLKLNAEKAYRWFRAAAEAGEAGAQFNLGMMYMEGKSIEQDYKRATKWLKRSAAQDYHDAIVQLRNMYMNGEGVKRSRSKAAAFQSRLSELPEQPGQHLDATELAEYCEQVVAPAAVEQDATLIAAAAGDTNALYALSLRSEQTAAITGQGQASQEALELLKMAASGGHMRAGQKLAEIQRTEFLRRAAEPAEEKQLSAAQKRHEFLKRAAAGK